MCYNKTMNIIIDASCIIAVLMEEPERNIILEKTKDAILFAPTCLPFEIGNSLSAMAKSHRIDTAKAIETINVFKQIPVQLIDFDIEKAVQIATEENHYAYDAYYIECALENGFPLLSLDKGLLEIAKKRGVLCL